MHPILQQPYPAHPRGIPPASKSPRLEGTRGERVWGQHPGCGEAPWLRGQELESRKTEMPLISISFCVLSSNASSPPAALGHGLAGRASLRAITTSGREGGGGGKPDSAPSTDIPCHPSPLHPGVAQGHLLPTDMPIWDGELRGIASLFLPWTRTWGTSGPFSFQERARSSLPSTFGHLAGPAAPGTRAPQSHSVPEPAPQFPALQEQFQDSF